VTNFDFQPTLVGPALIVRPLQASDHQGLFTAASDPLIWADHPVTNRHESAVFDPYFSFLQASGKAVAIIDRASDRIIGCSQFYTTPTPAAHISIGYTFLVRAFWGGKTNLQLKALMLGHLFAHRDEAWFHVAPSN
jgi:hypothetical protein